MHSIVRSGARRLMQGKANSSGLGLDLFGLLHAQESFYSIPGDVVSSKLQQHCMLDTLLCVRSRLCSHFICIC